MAVIALNADEDGLRGVEALRPALDALPNGRSVTIMIHGYRFSPFDSATDPHRHILSLTPRRDCWKAVSWPRHLHLDRPGTGLGIGFGWHAHGTLREVAGRALETAASLADLIAALRRLRPDLAVNLMAHSLGARVALGALAQLDACEVRRMILMSGAEYRGRARAAMATPAGDCVRVLNVGSRQNALFDGLFRLSVPAPAPLDRALSAGLTDVPGWCDLPIDNPAARAALAGLGFRTRPPTERICHWSTYMRPGLFALYRRVLDPVAPDMLGPLNRALQATPESLPVGKGTVWRPV